jgi:LPP20 lipoprotein
MRFTTTLTALAVAMTLAACGSKPRQEAVPDCKFLENPSERAPNWACAPHVVEGYKDTGMGIHPKSGAGAQFSKDQAAAKARAALALQMKARVSQGIKDYVATTGTGASETVDRAASSTTNQITAETLAGSKIIRETVDAKGNIYVLVGMDIEASRNVVQAAVQTSMRNDAATWQRLQGNRSQAELAAEISKFTSR